MGLPLLPLLVFAALQAGSNISKSSKQRKYNEDVKTQNKRDRWKSAIQRAVGGNTVFGPSSETSEPNTTTEDVLGAIGSIGSQAYGSAAGRSSVGKSSNNYKYKNPTSGINYSDYYMG